MRSLLLFIPLVAMGCGIGSYGEFRDQLATRWCERQVRCGEVGLGESTTHCSLPDPLLITIRGAIDVPTSVSEGRMRFSPDRASECLAAVHDSPCDPAQAADDFVRHCHAVVVGIVPNGKSCSGTEECLGGVCVDPDCNGTCTPYAPPGGPCVKSGGTPDLTCDPSMLYCDDGDATCHDKKEQGIACAGDGECLFDFVCVAGKCDDTTRTARGDTCVATSPPCKDGDFCDDTGSCAALAVAGANCFTPDGCVAGLACANGICSTWLDSGGACFAGPSAIASGCPATQTCTAGACAVVAGVKVGPLEHCDGDADCATGLYCLTSGNYCYYAGGVGAGCTGNRECGANLQCAMGTCHTPGSLACPAVSDGGVGGS